MTDDRKPSPTAYRHTPQSMSAVAPPQHKTLSLEKPPDWAVAMFEKVTATHAAVQNIGNEVAEINSWKNSIDEWKESVDDRLKRNSTRATQTSEADLAQDAAIAAAVTRQRELEENAADTQKRVVKLEGALAKNTELTEEIKSAVKGFFKEHPAISTALVQLILVVIALVTWKLKTLMGGQ